MDRVETSSRCLVPLLSELLTKGGSSGLVPKDLFCLVHWRCCFFFAVLSMVYCKLFVELMDRVDICLADTTQEGSQRLVDDAVFGQTLLKILF